MDAREKAFIHMIRGNSKIVQSTQVLVVLVSQVP